MAITIETPHIRQMSRTAAQSILDGIVANHKLIEQGGIDTPLRLCHFMAQLAHESAHFRTAREFASGAAYEGRSDLGNIHVGDGPKYRGRGLIQTTGRANYKEATNDIRKIDPSAPDFEADPVRLEQFPWALLAGITYWQRRNINQPADRDDIRTVTRRINGGLNGLSDRIQYLAKAKAIWLDPESPSASRPVLRMGDKGDDVMELQNELIDAGFRVRVDGDFGRHTDEAVRSFQELQGLKVDGVVGARTWALLLLT